MNRYKGLFENIEVPQNMAERIEQGLQNKAVDKKGPSRRKTYRLVASLAACFILVMGIVYIHGLLQPDITNPPLTVANPMQQVDSPEELQNYLPFAPLLPAALPEGWTAVAATVYNGTLAEVIYSNGNDEVRYRTAQGSSDISGDYTLYLETREYNGYSLKGEQELVALVIWTDDEFSFSLNFTPAVDDQTALSWADAFKVD